MERRALAPDGRRLAVRPAVRLPFTAELTVIARLPVAAWLAVIAGLAVIARLGPGRRPWWTGGGAGAGAPGRGRARPPRGERRHHCRVRPRAADRVEAQ